MANSQQPVIDRHPQKQRIIDALLRQESPYSIAKWVNPPVNKVTIWRYRCSHIAPALQRAAARAKLLEKQGLAEPNTELSPEAKQIVAEAKLDLVEDPIMARVNAKYARFDQVIPGTIASKDYAAFASVDKAETAALRFHAELYGRLQPGTNFGQVQVVIGYAKPDTVDQDQENPDQEPVIELGVFRR